MNGSSNDMKARMARYEQELLRLRNRSNAPAAPTVPSVQTPTHAALRVQVVSEQGMPIVGALVTVMGKHGDERRLQYVRFTDKSGGIETLTLPERSDIVYEISAAAPGFFKKTEGGLRADGGTIDRTIRLQALPEYREEW